MYKFISSCLRVLTKALFRIKVTNADNLPKDGACIYCFNHISCWDPLVIACAMERRITFIAKEELFKIPVVGAFLKATGSIPVKRNSGDIGAMKASLKVLKNNEVLGIFPTGTRERKNKNAPAKSGVAFIAVKSQATVVPIYINSNYRIFSEVELLVGTPSDFGSYEGRKIPSDELQTIADGIYGQILCLGDKN